MSRMSETRAERGSVGLVRELFFEPALGREEATELLHGINMCLQNILGEGRALICNRDDRGQGRDKFCTYWLSVWLFILVLP